jgi:hypothetical protein
VGISRENKEGYDLIELGVNMPRPKSFFEVVSKLMEENLELPTGISL